MSKRDAAQLGVEEKEERGTKQPRCSEAAKDVTTAAAASSASSSSCDWLVSAPSDCGFLIVGVGVFSADFTLTQARTRQLVSAIRGDGSLIERVQAACALLKADGERAESLLDMSLLVDGDEVGSVCALFHLLRLLAETGISPTEDEKTYKLKERASELFQEVTGPLLPRLLASFDSTLTDGFTGNNALHELLSRLVPTTSSFAYKIVKALIQRGVDIHQRNKVGCTAMLSQSAGLSSRHASAPVLRLLLQHGADVNAQDHEGDTLLHHLIRGGAWKVLREFLEVELVGLDLCVANQAGHTPAHSAASMLTHFSYDSNRTQIHAAIQGQADKWHAHTRPAVLAALSEPLIPDLAKLVLGYIDGSGLPFTTQVAVSKAE